MLLVRDVLLCILFVCTQQLDLTADFSSSGPISPITPHPSLSEMGAARAFVRHLRLLLAGRSAASTNWRYSGVSPTVRHHPSFCLQAKLWQFVAI